MCSSELDDCWITRLLQNDGLLLLLMNSEKVILLFMNSELSGIWNDSYCFRCLKRHIFLLESHAGCCVFTCLNCLQIKWVLGILIIC